MSSLAHSSAITGHVVCATLPAPGHWVTLLVFAVKLVKRRPTTIVTILTAGNHCERIQHALGAYFTDAKESQLKGNMRVIKTGGEDTSWWQDLYLVSLQTYGPYLISLLSCSEIVCTTGKTYPGINAPNCFILDYFFGPLIDIIRSTSQTKIPIYAWHSACTASLLRFKSTDIGGFGDAATDAPILAKQRNKSVEEVSYEMYFPSKGKVCNLPGVPPMYDYEYHAERPPLEIAMPMIQTGIAVYRFLRECDGVFGVSDNGLEPEANQVLRDWFSETNRKVYMLGPLVPDEHESKASLSEVSDFLSRMQERHGEHSVIYISFGTTFMPQGPGLIKILEKFLDMNIPLIYSFASPGSLPDNIVERMNRSDRVYTSSWLPQRMILGHPATAVFLSHGGQNSVSEAISAGVPLIIYPITADQPIVASLVSLKFKVGYELIEIRTGEALRPAYRGAHPTGTLEAIEKEIRDVISQVLGPYGDEKRKNICLLREKRNASWDENGSSKQDFERFIRDHLP